MTYYRWNTKYIEHAENALAQPRAKLVTAYQWAIRIIFTIIAICCLITKQYTIMIVSLLIGAVQHWGIGDETWKKDLRNTREMYLSIITLEDDVIVLHSGNGRLEKTISYTEIYGMEQVVLPAPVECFIPDAKIQRPRVCEEIAFICLYTDRCRLAPNVVFEDCWNNSRVILFPFYQSAWDILTDKQIQNVERKII